MELLNIPFKVCPKCGCTSVADEDENQRRIGGLPNHEQQRRWECGLRVTWTRYWDYDGTENEIEKIWQESPCQIAHREGQKVLQTERNALLSELDKLYQEAANLQTKISHLDDQLQPLDEMVQLDKAGRPIAGTEHLG